MKIRFWGARGSLTVSGPEFLTYGGDTTCVEVRTKNDEIVIVDAGSGIRNLGNAMIAEKRNRFTILFTHAHWDHIIGFPFFKPLYFSSTEIEISGCQYSQETIQRLLSSVMHPPFFPVKISELKSTIRFNSYCEETMTVGSMDIVPVYLNHPNNAIGYKFIEDGKSFVFLTDNEIGFPNPDSRELSFVHPSGREYGQYLEFCRGADLLVHDCEYTPEEYFKNRMSWGHSNYRDALTLGIEAGVKRFGLFHHNQDRTDDEIDAIVQKCRDILKERAVAMECFGVRQGFEITL